MAQSSPIRQLAGLVSRPGFWLIVVVLVLLTIPHYHEVLKPPAFVHTVMQSLNLERQAFERILFLAPIVWAGFIFGWKGSLVTSMFALACMLPRAIFFSDFPRDAFFETSAVFIIGNVLSISFASLRRERDYRVQLEATHQELERSAERYRQLFENALDAIWLHDLEGNIIAVNKAAEKLTGYRIEELTRMNVKGFLSEDSLGLASQIRSRLVKNEPVEPYEQHMFRKDGSEAFLQIATSLVLNNGEPAAFQHIARDVTEQKRMQENQRFYLRQATRAQEEERKRISRELHDGTVQELVVLSRQVDNVASNKGVAEGIRHQLEELLRQVNDIIQSIRRLSQDLRPAALDRLGLLPALEWLAADVTKYSGIETTVKADGKERRFSEEAGLLLFRITQEALRNVWRHSQATRAEIKVEFEESKTRLVISDNGKGFNLPKSMGDLARDGKLGLAGMQERAQLLGATIRVESAAGKGSRVIVELPA